MTCRRPASLLSPLPRVASHWHTLVNHDTGLIHPGTDITGTGTGGGVVVVVVADVSYWVTVSSAKDLITEDILTFAFCYKICQYNNFLVLISFTEYATTRLDGKSPGLRYGTMTDIRRLMWVW